MNSRPIRNACGQPAGVRLQRVLQAQAVARAVAEEPPVERQVVGGGDEHDLADAGEHQRRERVVDHRLVVDRQQLLGDDAGHRVQPGAHAAGEDQSLHGATSLRLA